MKDSIFKIAVALLTPIYFIIKIFSYIIEFSLKLGSPIVEGIYILLDNMTKFWKKILRRKEK